MVSTATLLPCFPTENVAQQSYIMSRETTALVLKEVKGPFALETVKLDAFRPDDSLVEIHATGICHTDLSCAIGVLSANVPAVFGHEGVHFPCCSVL